MLRILFYIKCCLKLNTSRQFVQECLKFLLVDMMYKCHQESFYGVKILSHVNL